MSDQEKNNNTPKILVGANKNNANQPDLFHIYTQIEIDGIEMGVLDNGQAYLSQRGLAKFCGIDAKTLGELSSNWEQEKQKPRGQKILESLKAKGHDPKSLFLLCEYNGTRIKAYPEPVCLTLLEYYAFEVEDDKKIALNRVRSFLTKKFTDYVYSAVGYNPEEIKSQQWRYFTDRTERNYGAVPLGYFSVFQESAPIFISLIKHGVIISDKIIMDVSIGITWSNYWKSELLEKRYGERLKYQHNYPLYYRQAKSNPQKCFIYPLDVLGEFRKWLENIYLPAQFTTYLLNQLRKGNLDEVEADSVVRALTGNSLSKLEDKKK